MSELFNNALTGVNIIPTITIRVCTILLVNCNNRCNRFRLI